VPYIGLIQLIGKYLFLAGLYVFLFRIFRELFRGLRHEAVVETSEPALAHTPERLRETVSASPAARAPVSVADVTPVASTSPVESTPARPCLVVKNPGEAGVRAGEVFPMTAAVTIGRAADNSIRISDRYVSNHHAIIFLKSGRRILRDRDSTNGTLRNGRRIAGEVVLNSGDLVGIGTVEFQYRA